MRPKRTKNPTITYARLKREVDKLIDWYEEEGRAVNMIPLFPYQYRVFLEKHPDRIYRGYQINQTGTA